MLAMTVWSGSDDGGMLCSQLRLAMTSFLCLGGGAALYPAGLPIEFDFRDTAAFNDAFQCA